MPVVIPPGYALVIAKFVQSQTGMPMSNSFGVKLDAPLTQGAVDGLSTDLAVAYKTVLATGSLWSGLHVVEGQDGDPFVWDSSSGAGAGTRSISAPTTPQVQLLADKKTQLGGRKFRGRTFLPDVAEADVGGNGAVISGTLTLVNAFCASVLVQLTDTPYDGMVLLHQDATIPTVVTSYTADPFAATLRRRYPR
jgi:hypothetical protein